MPTDFSRVLASTRATGAATSQVVVPPDWLQGRTVFGGMQMALAARAMRAALPVQARALPLRSAQATFIGPVLGGDPITLRAQTLRCGRSTAHARCDMMHGDGEVACTAVGIFGTARASQFIHEMSRPDPGRRPEEVAPSVFRQPAPAFTQHFEWRWALGDVPFSGCTEPRSIIYLRLRDLNCGAEEALLALADAPPSPVLAMLSTPAPASSLSWMIEVLRDPAQLDPRGWTMIDTEVRAGTDGYLSQTSMLYGPDGHAYSVSHQTVAVFG